MSKHSEQKSALIIVDMQNDFCHDEGTVAKNGGDVSRVQATVSVIERLSAEARAVGIPVIFIQTTHSEETDSRSWKNRPNASSRVNALEGTWGADFYQLKPQPGDIIINKYSYSAFTQTDLEQRLKKMGITSLIYTGVATNVCVETTARHGFTLDFDVTLVRDGCGGYDTELEEGTFINIQKNFGRVLVSEQIIHEWNLAKT